MSTAIDRTTPELPDEAFAEFSEVSGIDEFDVADAAPEKQRAKEPRPGTGPLPTSRARKRYWIIFAVLAIMALGFATATLAWGNPMPFGSRGFWLIVEMRVSNLAVMIVVAFCQATATVAFQTVTHNRILTPSIMGYFIDENRDEFGVEPIVRVLRGTAARIAVSSYYAYKLRRPSARAIRDCDLMVVIRDIYEANYSCYGVRKMWKAINRDHADRFGPVARCTVERLMRQLGIDGVRRKRKRPKTASARAEECPEDLVEREFTAPAPNCLWVADITYVPTP